MNTFLKDDGSPNISSLIATLNRCTPVVAGGLEWLDNVRFCRWPNQWTDGRKHDQQGVQNGGAQPWDGASDVRPFVVDNIINETVATLTEAFWRSMAQPGSASSEEGQYAVALADYLIWNVLYDSLVKEVELSAQYVKHYGWTVLAPRWCREIGLKRYTLKLADIQQGAAQEMQMQQAAAAQGQQPGMPPSQAAAPTAPGPITQMLMAILDPTMEDQAVQLLGQWYQQYVESKLPEDVRDRAPKIADKTIRRCVRDLRTQQQCISPIPYLCRDEPEVCSLKPWDEAFIPPENTTANELLFQREWIGEAELRGRILTEDYDKDWVEAAVKFKGQTPPSQLPVGVSGQALRQLGQGGTPVPVGGAANLGNNETGLIEIIHAVYRTVDDDGIPGVYMTTFHRSVAQVKTAKGGDGQPYATHGLAETEGDGLPYVEVVNEWWCRSVTASRSIPEMAHTDQNLIKGTLDAIVDRTSITILPPVNVYESPTGTKYVFAPAKQNYVRQGREPKFMEVPSGQGMADGVETHELVSKRIDNRFALLSGEVPPVRVQTAQSTAVRRFLLSWTTALQQILCLCQKRMSDEDFAEITGAPEGWLDQHREDTDLLQCGLHFDVRELDSELTMKRVEAVNKIVLPADVMGTVNRGKWARVMMRCINPAWAKEVMMPVDDASQALFDKTSNEILKMFAGNPPNYVDKNDPTAASMLQFTQQIVTANPTYLRALTDEALVALAGQNAPMLAQQIGPRRPDPRFSELLMKWIDNLKFIGVTQPKNKEIGRIGVDPEA